MNNLYSLPDKNVAEQRDLADHRRKNALIVERLYGQVVHLQAIGHVSDSGPICIAMCDHDDLEEGLEGCYWVDAIFYSGYLVSVLQ